MLEKRTTAKYEIIANNLNSPLFQKFPLESKNKKEKVFP